ncbi:hypothetical protein Ahy_B08g092630 isoform E [Arachis hypogaea]|uniref:Uncharacterized protein n=1 Tax=Arachis hypogaea TaxID=3818 RepID=A0A444Y476_ARAHY|nr:hypothetical protein Ahy_B08g092630 isoform E [Arachis hypogaea]
MQKQNLGKDSSSQTGSVSQIYDEFCPILLNQFKSRDYTKFETFDASLDEFYSKIESQRSEQQQKAKENSAAQKLNKIRQDQENRVHTLRKEADHCVKMAELIEYNLEDVDAAILAVHVALAKEFSSAAADSIHSDEDQALGLAYQQLGRYTATIKSYGHAIELDDKMVFALVESGNISLTLGSFRKVGKDEFGYMLCDILKQNFIDTSSVRATVYASNKSSSCFLTNANTTTDATVSFRGRTYAILA